ncbi:uncharacterized protein CANTADRAFT_49195 [Suhomyces tanzawaensis NRRL Y-17324]|uniref:Dynactin subunit 4 n=1 Tax=Suhomyces tanzawaensis NRRL Y-17324 TaxID=984487 RepID=A0A1E4SJH3_9ASCO|nr:uncharacterized protein CANTADRAFT_49195 [Suhomyces tanzawaensis NRRL Y-17324]ODV79587.1 hypothetical protein CANTADRAFT_49195 [Suhomyces tanzawaensis NRRL Y-17324]
MSKIYNDSYIYCPKLATHRTLDGFSANSVHHLSQLYFCPSCQAHKSRYDCYHNIECKFCSHCITDYSHTSNDTQRCAKNCFVCPSCTSSLTIFITDHQINGKLGKAFQFSCVYCTYTYQSGVITSPKSLHSIISSEKKEAQHQTFYKYQQQLSTASDAPVKQSETRLKNLSLSNISRTPDSPIDTLGPEDISEVRNRVEITTHPDHSNQYPVARKLTVKKSYKCLNCNTFLLLPHTEDGLLPTTNKLRVKFNAVDYMPSIKLTNTISPTILTTPPTETRNLQLECRRTFLINLMNPLEVDMKIHVGSLPYIADNFITGGNKLKFKVELSIPIPDIVIKSSGSTKNLIKTIPTACLTTKNTISKAELISRMGSALFKEKPEDTLDVSESSESLVAQGAGWSLIPLFISVQMNDETDTWDSSDLLDIKIPLYITVQAELPQAIKVLKLSKQNLSYGYWNVIDIGTYQVTK